MGSKTFTTFQSDLLFELGQRDDLDSYKDDWVNAAYLKLTTQNRFWGLRQDFYFPELETVDTTQDTVDGTAYINVPTNAIIVRDVFDDDNLRRLTNISWRQYIGYTDRADTDAEGPPTEWVRSGSKIYLHPTPDDAYDVSVYYRTRPTALSDGDDTTAIGAEWDEIIVQIAAILAHMKLGEFDKAAAKKSEFLDAVSGLIGIYDQEKKSRKEVRVPSYPYLTNHY